LARIGDLRFFRKEMEDGSRVVGIFNLGDKPAESSIPYADLYIPEGAALRDLWGAQAVRKQRRRGPCKSSAACLHSSADGWQMKH
jgi:hypothetical protein